MPDFTLIYFNARGSAEPIRWMFTYADIPFNDERIEKEDWSDRKSSIPGGKLPVLMVDERPLPQSQAIARFIAKEAGLVPEDNLDAAYCDALVDTVRDVMEKVYSKIMSEEDEDERKRWFMEDFFPYHMAPVLARLNARLSGREWFVGDQVTWADFMIAHAFGEIHCHHPEAFEEYSAVTEHIEKVRELPAIKDWIENRPETTH
ncbi:hematopoietic prostaglandin D synthase-like [Penaeus chinensis]|uniref:hematopoietic prostaglandin D synthase-like n=1 Tax=Penaeus chinensis TaxID=139456 RepID=UPI001FB7732D|nr:hematopoietic prostaglandin D synthase-like [Penaeus chinensis]